MTFEPEWPAPISGKTSRRSPCITACASPSNAVTLNDLMHLYASMQEFDQAISAAATFPQALHASEQCMSTLGRVYLAKNEFDDAIRWFDAALERNATLGEASYYKAVSLLAQPTPDLNKAIAAARVARNAGFPNAESVLREAEERARR